MNKKISIIIPVYNVSSYIDECLFSVINQNYNNIEIICVDDGSKDDSGKKCDLWAKKDSRIIVLHQENAGVSNARNRALELASGEFIGFVDADDKVDPLLFTVLLDSIEKNKADLSCCFYKNWYENKEEKQPIPQRIGLLEKNEALYQMLLPFGYRGYLFTKLFRKAIIEKDEKIRFDEKLNMMEDLHFVINYIRKSQTIFFTNKTLYKYRVRNNSAIHTLPKEATLIAFEKILPLIQSFDRKVQNMIRWTYYTTLIDYLWFKKEISHEEQKSLLKKISKERQFFFTNHKYSKKGFIKKLFQEFIIRLRKIHNHPPMVSNV